MLELAILGLLLESPMHGYELRKRLTGLLGAFRAFSYGSLYPTLRRMQADGLIAEDAGADGTVKRRARRVYELTPPVGSVSPSWWRTRGPRTTPTTGSAFTSPSSVAPPPRRGCESWKAGDVRSRSVEKASATPSGGHGSLDRYTRQLHQLGLESSEREVRWLNELIAAEQSSTAAAPKKKEGEPDHG